MKKLKNKTRRLIMPVSVLCVIFFVVQRGLALSEPVSTAEPAVSAPAMLLGIAHAVHLRPTIQYGEEIQKFSDLVGKRPAMVMYFTDWQGNSNAEGLERYFDPYLLNTINNTLPPTERPVIMLTWQPLHGRKATGCSKDYEGAIPLPDILNGECDSYIRGFAQALKARTERFLIRFAHEMNITDSPWWVGHIGADPSLYVAVWRHVHAIFEEVGVPNVEWVWSPNYQSNPPEPWNSLHAYYPGDDVVDWIGLSGYNWYDTRQPIMWRTFTDLYDAVLKDLACSYPKPQIIAEIGSVEGNETLSKAEWIKDTFYQAPSYPFLRAIQWFNDYAYADSKSPDFRVTTSTAQDGDVRPLPDSTGAWTNAYRNAIADTIYTTTLPHLTAATPPDRYCGKTFTVYPSSLLMAQTDLVTLRLVGINYAESVKISLDLPSDFSVSISPTVLDPPWGTAQIQIQSIQTPVGLYYGTVSIRGSTISTTLPISIQVTTRVYRIRLPIVLR